MFQLTTITLGVLIALSFDAALKWNADRTLMNEAHATIALEIADNRRDLERHLAAFADRLARIDTMLKLIGELEAGTEPTVREIDLGMGMPSLSTAAWQTAERTGALALMEYVEVQRLADVYALQSLVSDEPQGSRCRTSELRAETLSGPTVPGPGSIALTLVGARP